MFSVEICILIFLIFLFFFKFFKLLGVLHSKILIKYKPFSWYQYLLVLIILFLVYFVLSHFFAQLDQQTQICCFISIFVITGINFIIINPYYGLFQYIFSLFFCIFISLFSLMPSFLLLGLFSLHILEQSFLILYFQILVIIAILILTTIEKCETVSTIVADFIILQCTFFHKMVYNHTGCSSFLFILLISIMFRSFIVTNFFMFPLLFGIEYRSDGVFRLFTTFLRYIFLDNENYRIESDFLGVTPTDKFRVITTSRTHQSKLNNFNKFLHTRIAFKGFALQCEPLLSSALTGQSTILVNTINTISATQPLIFKNFTQSLIQKNVSKPRAIFQFNSKVREHRLMSSRLINAPVLLETEEDVYGVLLHLQEYYSNSSKKLEQKDNLFYLFYGKDGHQEIVSGFELWVYLNFLQGSIRTAMYESLLKTIVLHREHSNATLLRATTGQGTAGVSYLGDLVVVRQDTFTFYNFKYSLGIVPDPRVMLKNSLYFLPEVRNYYLQNAINHELSKLQYVNPKDNMNIITYSSDILATERKLHKLNSRPDCSLELLGPNSLDVTEKRNIFNIQQAVAPYVKDLSIENVKSNHDLFWDNVKNTIYAKKPNIR